MDENTKNLILGTIYSILLLIIFATFINKIITSLLELFYPRDNAVGAGSSSVLIIPVFAGSVIVLVIAITLTYAVIRLIKIKTINEFLEPNKFKVNTAIIVLAFIITLLILQAFVVVNAKWYDILMNVLMFGSNVFSGSSLIMVWLFPIIVYYSIVCLIYKLYIEVKEIKKV